MSLCVDDDVPFNATQTAGIRVMKRITNIIHVQKDKTYPDGVVVLRYAKKVILMYMVGLYKMENEILPMDKIGTEYFVFFRKFSSARVYTCRVGATEKMAFVRTHVIGRNKFTDPTVEHIQLGSLELHLIEKHYDYTGSRILTSNPTTLFCNTRVMTKSNDGFPHQLLPTMTCGLAFNVPVWVKSMATYFITTDSNTTVTSSNSITRLLPDRGTTFEMDKGLSSNKPLCAFLTENDKFRHLIPVEQYVKIWLVLIGAELPPFEIKYFVPGVEFGNMETSVLFFGARSVSAVSKTTDSTKFDGMPNAGMVTLKYNFIDKALLFIENEVPFGGTLLFKNWLSIENMEFIDGANREISRVSCTLFSKELTP